MTAEAAERTLLLSADMEIHRLETVGAAWRTVAIVNDMTAPVVVCTYVLPSNADNEGVTRVRNVSPGSFEVRVQQFETSNAVTASEVHCLVAESGVHTLLDGRTVSAGTVLSDGTNGNSPGWTAALSENITSSLGTTFTNPVVLGQVMTFNDSRASVFWTWNGSNRGTPPTSGAIYVGKHIGMIAGSRNNETLGYIVVEEGAGTSNGLDYAFRQGPNAIAGAGNTPPYTYSVSEDFESLVATQAAENGGNGGWAVLYGADPLPAGGIQLAIDEETVQGDTTRRHINEEVFYGGVENVSQTAVMAATKTVSVSGESASEYTIPGSDVVYALTVQNTGSGSADEDTLFLVDSLPSEIAFYNDDFDGPSGPVTGAIDFDPQSSGLTLGSSDVGFSIAATPPADFSACNYMPISGVDEAVRHICFAPKGWARPSSLYPSNTATIRFRARIK